MHLILQRTECQLSPINAAREVALPSNRMIQRHAVSPMWLHTVQSFTQIYERFIRFSYLMKKKIELFENKAITIGTR